MSVSDLSTVDQITRLTGSARGTLQRAQDDFARQMQSAMASLGGDASTVRNTVAPVVAQVTQAVESVLAQLQASQALGTASVVPAKTDAAQATATPPTANKTPDAVGHYLLPGEPGAGLPVNYRNSPLYQDWLAQKPQMGESVTEFGKALSAWQKANPYYIDPDRYDTFEAYLGAVQVSTSSSNHAAQADPARYTSFLSSYYGPAAVADPWGSRLGNVTPEEMVDWSEGTKQQYDTALAVRRSIEALESAGLLGVRGS